MLYVIREKVETPAEHAYMGKVETYKRKFVPLIEAEKRCAEKVVIDRLKSWGVERLREDGYCMTGMLAFWLSSNHLGRPVAAFMSGAGESLPFHRFSYGTQVLISRHDPLKEEGMRKGSVVKVTPQQIDVTFEDMDTASSIYEDIGTGFWRLDLGHSSSAFERMREALDRLHFDPQKIERDWKNKPNKRELVLHGTTLRDVLLENIPSDPGRNLIGCQSDTLESSAKGPTSSSGAFSGDMRIQSWARRYMRPKPVVVEGDPHIPGLNVSQIRAMATMIGERISLIHGPPGTGKTRTIVETVSLLKRHFVVPHPILVCTYTHAAVNNLLESFVENGLKPLRIGFDGKMLAHLEPHMLEYQFDNHPLKPMYEDVCAKKKAADKDYKGLLAQIKKLGVDIGKASDENKRQLEEALRRDKSRLRIVENKCNSLRMTKYRVSQRIMRNLIQSADVICTTCIRSAFHMLDVVDFPVVFLDEASMSTEPASLIPLMKGCRHLALIGDHKQLPPVVVSLEADRGGLGRSLFERLEEEGNVPTAMLDTQYRMHPAISKFPSMEFYDQMLLDGTVQSGQIAPSLMPPSSMHLIPHPQTGKRPSVIFIDHQGQESAKSRSRVNYTEAYIVCNIVQDLLLQNEDLYGVDIGIIAPYKSQVNLITRLFLRNSAIRKHFAMTLGGEARASEIANIEVKTVDGFEGRQKEAIIFSTVRNNQPGHIGFLADQRRMNVGLTRAKRALFVIGSMSTLAIGKYGRNSIHMDEVLEDSGKADRISKGAAAWRNFTQFLIDEKLVLELRGESLKKVLKPFYC